MYLLTLDDTVKTARSLNYAKALAPQMFARLGTQAGFRTILVTKVATGVIVASYGRLGWRDIGQPKPLAPVNLEYMEDDCDEDAWDDYPEGQS